MIRALLKDIFIPEKVGSYYLVAKRTIGFDIGKTEIYATQLYCNGKSIIIEKCLKEPLELDTAKSYAERVTQAIKKIISSVDRHDEIRSSLSSSSVIFKELSFPFSDYAKIRSIITYELEPSLPFSINEAIVDFIVTNTNTETKTTTVFAAAIKKEFVAEHYAFFENAGVKPDVLTIDMFDMYGFSLMVPEYYRPKEIDVILALGFHGTHLLYIAHGQLKSIRSIPKGLIAIAKSLSQTLQISIPDALEEFLRFGLEHNTNPAYHDAALKALTDFWGDIQFTLNAFVTKFNPQERIATIFLFSKGAEINKMTEFIKQQTGAECVLFDANALLKLSNIHTKDKKRIPHSNTLSLSTALGTPIVEALNFAQYEFSPSTMHIFYRQMIAMLLLMLLPFGVVIFNTYWQSHFMAKSVRASEQEVIKYLRENNLAESNNIRTALEEAQENVQKEAEIWFAFSSQTRFSFLKYLEQLSTAIDRDSIGLKLNKLIITYDMIVMDGEVANFDELTVFERELRESRLFVNVPSLQNIKFPRLELLLKKSGEETQWKA